MLEEILPKIENYPPGLIESIKKHAALSNKSVDNEILDALKGKYLNKQNNQNQSEENFIFSIENHLIENKPTKKIKRTTTSNPSKEQETHFDNIETSQNPKVKIEIEGNEKPESLKTIRSKPRKKIWLYDDNNKEGFYKELAKKEKSSYRDLLQEDFEKNIPPQYRLIN